MPCVHMYARICEGVIVRVGALSARDRASCMCFLCMCPPGSVYVVSCPSCTTHVSEPTNTLTQRMLCRLDLLVDTKVPL
jgi:hypothetical protein